MNKSTLGELDKRTWMSKVLDIDTLKLTDIVWPGAHNAGMDKKDLSHEEVAGHWTSCQNDTFAWQLDQGARAFDIRLGYTTEADRPLFYFHHNGFRSTRVLDDLIDAVLSFLDRNPDEFIILDFHELGDGKQFFDHKQLVELLIRRLGPRAVHALDGFRTVGELKKSSSQRRVIMAVPPVRELDREYFWRRIAHKWRDNTFTAPDELRRYISQTLEGAPFDAFLWSLSATGYSLLGPAHLKDHINAWFDTAQDWITRCSIISTDFFDESEIVRYCWSASSMKAVYGDSLYD
ncbi:MAG: phospholipase [Pseudomonas sp.]|uniref:phospholipase n=1 Tax=Pseudomonas sp. TaxID=306 RepID=UPI003D6DFD71